MPESVGLPPCVLPGGGLPVPESGVAFGMLMSEPEHATKKPKPTAPAIAKEKVARITRPRYGLSLAVPCPRRIERRANGGVLRRGSERSEKERLARLDLVPGRSSARM